MKGLYWLIALAAHAFVVYTLFKMGYGITGTLWLMVGLVLIYLFYGYYFPSGSTEGQWPPYIRPCPDYLTQIAPNKCVDFVGIGGGIKKSLYGDPPAVNNMEYVFDSSGTAAQKAQNAKSMGLSWEGVV